MSYYVSSKIEHMQRMGIPAGIGRYGGACPKWLEDERKAADKAGVVRTPRHTSILALFIERELERRAGQMLPEDQP